MKISLNWLKEYIKIPVSAPKFAHRLTMAGLEVEKMTTLEDDTVYELEITPNRADCLNLLGIAREVSAIFDLAVKYPKVKKIQNSQNKLNITILDKKSCAQYIGIFIRDLKISESPAWLKKHLASIGGRSINNIVDIINFSIPVLIFHFDLSHYLSV